MRQILFLIALIFINFIYADSILFLPDVSNNHATYNDKEIISSQGDTILKNAQIGNPEESHNALLQDTTSQKSHNAIPQDTTSSLQNSNNINASNSNTLSLNPAYQPSAIPNNMTKSQLTTFSNTAKPQIYTIVNGATLILTTLDTHPKDLQIGHKTIRWIPHPTHSRKKIALLPIPYYTQFGKRQINNSITLNIKEGNYRKENITLANTSKIKPNEEASKRIAKELAEANKIYTTYTKKRYWNKPFIYPLVSAITSPFGSARLFNGEVKSFHSGTDFRATIGTPISAVNDGVVVIAKERFLAGKSVVISHGEGVFSMYYHCSEIKVKLGQKVKRGEIIALSGDTGRVTGPHLHFAMFVNGVQIDPMDFIAKINALFEDNITK